MPVDDRATPPARPSPGPPDDPRNDRPSTDPADRPPTGRSERATTGRSGRVTGPPEPDDPRLDPEFVRTVPAPGPGEPGEAARDAGAGAGGTGPGTGDVHLVGVVHDHPASVHRVRAVVGAADPAVLALELPPVAVPLFESYADDSHSPPAFGGEMSAAVRAAGADARVVGIDAPDRRFLRLLAGRLLGERPPVAVAGRLCRGVLAVSRHALVCRLAAVLAARTGLRVEVDGRIVHDVTAADPPAAQVEDERRQVGRSRSLRRLASTPTADLRDDVREASMAAHLDALRADGDVVAVLGVAHLDGVARRLRPGDG